LLAFRSHHVIAHFFVAMNQLECMRIFAKVAECLNFSDAAKQLGISNSAVTRGLSALERHLNLRLINRTTRHVSLTPAGQSYVEGCADVILQVQRMEERVRVESRSAAGRLKLAVSALYAATELPALLTEFRQTHPLISFDLTIYETPNQVAPEDFEVCFMIEHRLRDSSLVCRSLGRARDVIVASPAYLARRGTPATPKELSDHDVLLDSESLMRYWTFNDANGVHRVTLVPTLSAQSVTAVARATAAGLGIARLPRLLIEAELADGRLTPLLERFEIDGRDRMICMLYAGPRYATQMVRSFVDFTIQRRMEKSFAPGVSEKP
jgi:DNA-binding transcriptional LysR family regulator